ncbi:HNH endonuclease [Escherichia coli]|uniref:HNH endonuclease n=1 Tax=Escherichia coli TaxID=562 RepID=UPI0020BF9A02|nr:HNH endonuclease [Escherichia coli]
MKCIICLEEKEVTSFGEEHVIPEAIGGSYIINNVCNSCNSNLGQKVDIKITNEFLSVCLRHEKYIRGKSGLLPIMFPGTFENEFDKKEKYRLEHDENGNVRPVLIYKQPSIKNVEEDIYSIQIAFDNSLSEDEMLKKSKQIISKEMKRRGVEIYDINHCFEKVNTNIKLSINREITNSDSFISILKMAYEFAASNINGYVDDEIAIAIADVLRKASYSDALDYVFMGVNSWGRGMFDKLFPDSHFIIIKCFDGILGALVSLHNIGFYSVKLSSESFVINNKPSFKMLINHIKDKNYEIISMD